MVVNLNVLSKNAAHDTCTKWVSSKAEKRSRIRYGRSLQDADVTLLIQGSPYKASRHRLVTMVFEPHAATFLGPPK
jgi:hypothetical protein